MWPAKDDECGVKVAARYLIRGEEDYRTLEGNLEDWLAWVGEHPCVDLNATLRRKPYIVRGSVHADVIFEGKPGSKLWRDWLVSFSSFADHASPQLVQEGLWDMIGGIYRRSRAQRGKTQ